MVADEGAPCCLIDEDRVGRAVAGAVVRPQDNATEVEVLAVGERAIDGAGTAELPACL